MQSCRCLKSRPRYLYRPFGAQQGEIDLRAALRDSEADEGFEAAIIAAINTKPEGHRFNVGGTPGGAQRMWQLGG